MKKVMLVFGTRPEAIKMCPLVNELKQHDTIETVVCVTGQHKEMLDQVLDVFRVVPDYNLGIMKANQTLFSITTSILDKIQAVLEQEKPDIVLVHGDTTTTFATALAAFYMGIKVGHVEAGLRTHNLQSPFPEEFNRQTTSIIADYHFAPTEVAKDNLLKEGRENIYVTGNTSIDSVKHNLQEDFTHPLLQSIPADNRILLMTMRRKDNLGAPMKRVFHTMRDIVETNNNLDLIFPVYPHPEEELLANDILGDHDRIHLITPLNHHDFLNIAARSSILLTDSGGLQEEAPALHRPLLLFRDETERQEAVSLGGVKIVGTDPTTIQQAVFELLNDEKKYRQMELAEVLFGDGHASEKILKIVEKYLSQQ